MDQDTILAIIEGYNNRGRLSKEQEEAYDWFVNNCC
jgi:hypothetical protein